MTTNQFKLPSPYTRTQLPPPEEDAVYNNHIKTAEFADSECREFGVAIFGIGRAGTIHLLNLIGNRRANILYIVDDDLNKLENVKKSYKRCLNETSFLTSKDRNKVFVDSKVDFVICASPTYTHEVIVRSALEHHKAVFCEKPVAVTLEETKALIDLSKKVNKPLLSAFNRRFDDSYSKIKEKVRQGEVGKVLTVKVCSRDSPLPSIGYLKTSDGIFRDCSVHDIDQIISVLGEYPNKVSVFAHANIPEIRNINDVDTVSMIMAFDSGALGIIDLSRQCVYGYDQRLEVFGEKGMIKAENKCPMQNLEEYKPEMTKKSPIYYSFASRYQDAYKRELEHFMNVLEGKDKLLITGQDLLNVFKIAIACETSWKTGQTVPLTWSKTELQ
ncbi:myo-inositol 2-dehydrogenase-like [Diabrotica undecimpunctata]|uniref:myo-inositol 2-dehydrogenase-like n=1 Tax=Diabrotica undecimpunctata TaxID=50387 RepID=UPI003B63D109